MSTPNKFYKTEAVIEARNCGDTLRQIKMMLENGGIDDIISYAVRNNINFDHDLDKNIMSFFRIDPVFVIKLQVSEIVHAGGKMTFNSHGSNEPEFRSTPFNHHFTASDHLDAFLQPPVSGRVFELPKEAQIKFISITYESQFEGLLERALEDIKEFMKLRDQFHSQEFQVIKEKGKLIYAGQFHRNYIDLDTLHPTGIFFEADYLNNLKSK